MSCWLNPLTRLLISISVLPTLAKPLPTLLLMTMFVWSICAIDAMPISPFSRRYAAQRIFPVPSRNRKKYTVSPTVYVVSVLIGLIGGVMMPSRSKDFTVYPSFDAERIVPRSINAPLLMLFSPCGRGFAPAGATRGLCGRPLDPFAALIFMLGCLRGRVFRACGRDQRALRSPSGLLRPPSEVTVWLC